MIQSGHWRCRQLPEKIIVFWVRATCVNVWSLIFSTGKQNNFGQSNVIRRLLYSEQRMRSANSLSCWGECKRRNVINWTYRQCTHNVTLWWVRVIFVAIWKATIPSVCIVEGHFTVNSIKILSVAQKCFKGGFMSPAKIIPTYVFM